MWWAHLSLLLSLPTCFRPPFLVSHPRDTYGCRRWSEFYTLTSASVGSFASPHTCRAQRQLLVTSLWSSVIPEKRRRAMYVSELPGPCTVWKALSKPSLLRGCHPKGNMLTGLEKVSVLIHTNLLKKKVLSFCGPLISPLDFFFHVIADHEN